MKKKRLIFIFLLIFFIVSIKIISGNLINLGGWDGINELKEAGEGIFEKYFGQKIEIKYLKISYVQLNGIEDEIILNFG